MVTRRGKLLDPWHLELQEPVPEGENRVEVRLDDRLATGGVDVELLINNPAFDFLRDEPDLYYGRR